MKEYFIRYQLKEVSHFYAIVEADNESEAMCKFNNQERIFEDDECIKDYHSLVITSITEMDENECGDSEMSDFEKTLLKEIDDGEE